MQKQIEQVKEITKDLSLDEISSSGNQIIANQQAEDTFKEIVGLLESFDENTEYDEFTTKKMKDIEAKVQKNRESADSIQSRFLKVKNSNLNQDVVNQQRVLSDAIDNHVALHTGQGPIKRLMSSLIPDFLARKAKDFTTGIKTSQEQIEGILTGLYEVKEDAEKRIEELKEQDFKMGQTIKNISTQVATLKIVQEKLNRYIEDLREVDAEKANIAETNLGSKIIRSIRDDLQLVNTLTAQRLNIRSVLTNQDAVTSELKSTMEIAKVALTTGTIIAVAAEATRQDIAVIKTVRETITKLNDETTKQIKENVSDTKKLIADKTINAQDLQKNFNESLVSIRETHKIVQEETVKNLTQIDELTRQQESMDKALNGLIVDSSLAGNNVIKVTNSLRGGNNSNGSTSKVKL